MAKLTKRIVDEAERRPAAYFIWCGDLPGFGVRILPSGKATYYVDYRNAAGERKRPKIGAHGKITCEEARKLALAMLGEVTRGGDPASERATRRNSLTVAQLCSNYMDAAEKGLIFGKKRQPKKASTIYQDHARINRHIAPLLGKKLVKELTRADVAKFIRDVTTGKTATVEKTGKRGKAVVTGGAGTAARAANFLGAILAWAIREGVLDSNPAHGVKRQADKKRTRRLTPEEYRKFGAALREAEAAGEAWQGVAGARLLALTGCRLGEIVNLTWGEVDAAGKCLRLEDSKEGQSTRPAGAAAFEVLERIERRSGQAHVLPGVRRGGAFGGLAAAFERIVKKAGLDGVTPHVLRHSFASTAADLGFVESSIAAMLGHAAGSVTSRYVHHLDSVLIAAADKVSGTIAAYLAGEAGAGEA